MQFSAAAASSPVDGVSGDQDTAETVDEGSPESSKTCRKIGPIRVSSGERGEGK